MADAAATVSAAHDVAVGKVEAMEAAAAAAAAGAAEAAALRRRLASSESEARELRLRLDEAGDG